MQLMCSEIQGQAIPEDMQCDGVIFSVTVLQTKGSVTFTKNESFCKHVRLLH
jgi:hypothetical protein